MRTWIFWLLCGCLLTVVGARRCCAQHEHNNHGQTEPLPPAVQAAPVAGKATWTREDLEAIAINNNPTLAQSQAHVTMARGRRIQSGLLPNPIIGYVGEEIGNEGRAGQQGGFIEQQIPTAGKLRLNRTTFAHEENQERWASEVQRLILQNSVRIAFYDTLAAQQLVQVRQQLTTIADEGVRITEQLTNVGQADRPDLLAVRIESRRAQVDLIEVRNRHERLWQQLTSLIGAPGTEMRPLAGDLDAADQQLDRDATLSFILQKSPELQIAYAGVNRAQTALARARVEPIPNLFAGASVQHDNATGDTISGAQLAVNLPVFDHNQGNILSAQGALRHACEEVDRVRLLLRSRFANAWERYATARHMVDEYDNEILPDAREAYDLYVQAFQRRAAAFPQVLISQRSYFEAQGDYFAALAVLRRAEVELNGFLLVDGMSQPEPHGAVAPEPPGLPVRSGR